MRKTLEKLATDVGLLVVDVGGVKSELSTLKEKVDAVSVKLGAVEDGVSVKLGIMEDWVGRKFYSMEDWVGRKFDTIEDGVGRNSVLLEAVDDKIVILAEGQEQLHEKIDCLQSVVSTIDEKISHLDGRLLCMEISSK